MPPPEAMIGPVPSGAPARNVKDAPARVVTPVYVEALLLEIRSVPAPVFVKEPAEFTVAWMSRL